MTAPAVPPAPAVPSPPAWPHRVVRAIDRLPGPAWLAYAALAVAGTILLELRFWVTGTAAVGVFDTNSLTLGAMAPVLIALWDHLGRSTGAAFDTFRPALAPTADADAIRDRLCLLPARDGTILAAIGVVLTAVTYAFSPTVPEIVGVPAWVGALLFPLQAFNTAIFFALIVRMIRQMTEIRRVLGEVTAVDIFRPGPLHALAGVGARSSMALVLLLGAAFLLLIPTQATIDVALAILPYFAIPTVLATAAFVVPLYGTHGRLVAEKRRLESVLDDRLERLLAELAADVDARRLDTVDGLSRAVGSVLQERDIVEKLSTWPWSPGTMRGFVSAILFPLAMFVLQHVLAGLLGNA
jgi:hypothetical protein